jgi:hypothetical protein
MTAGASKGLISGQLRRETTYARRARRGMAIRRSIAVPSDTTWSSCREMLPRGSLVGSLTPSISKTKLDRATRCLDLTQMSPVSESDAARSIGA